MGRAGRGVDGLSDPAWRPDDRGNPDGEAIAVLLFEARPSILIGGLIGGIIGVLIQATFSPDFIRRRALAYYRKRWDRELLPQG